jgi:hypothetical protein
MKCILLTFFRFLLSPYKSVVTDYLFLLVRVHRSVGSNPFSRLSESQ